MSRVRSSLVLLLLGGPLLQPGIRGQVVESSPQAAPPAAEVVARIGSLTGRVVSFDEQRVVIELAGHAGSRITVERALVPADTLYRLELTRIDRDDPEAWMGLAAFAAEHGLHRRQMEALEHAGALDPQRRPQIEADLAACREACASERLGYAEELRAAGELDRALRHLQQTAADYASCVSGRAAGDLVQRIQKDIKAERARAAALKEDRRRAREAGAELDDVAELLSSSEELVREARTVLGDYVKATRAFKKALALAESAENRLDRHPAATDPVPDTEQARLWDEVGRMRLAVRDQLVEIHVELGQIYLARGSTTAAYEHAGLAAAIDPDDGAVAALRHAIAASGQTTRFR